MNTYALAMQKGSVANYAPNNAGGALRSAGGASAHDSLKADGFVIYAGQCGLSTSLFRNSTMGAMDASDIDRLLACFGNFLR